MHDINYIMLIKQNEQISSTLQALGRRRHSRRCEIKPTKSQRSATSGKFLTVQWSRACWDTPSKERQIPESCICYHKQGSKTLGRIFQVLKDHIPHLGIMLWPDTRWQKRLPAWPWDTKWLCVQNCLLVTGYEQPWERFDLGWGGALPLRWLQRVWQLKAAYW